MYQKVTAPGDSGGRFAGGHYAAFHGIYHAVFDVSRLH